MLKKAKAASLPITDEDFVSLQPDPAAAPKVARKLPLNIRLIQAIDRRHYTVSAVDGCANPPDTCAVETEQEEQTAAELSAKGLEVLPLDARRRVAAMWETAAAVAEANGFKLDPLRDMLLTLFQARVPLVTNEEELTRARQAVSRLMLTTIAGARQRGFMVLSEFFLTEAIFKSPRLFPLTD